MTSLHRRAFWGRTATAAVRILTLAALALLTDCGFSTLVPAQGLNMRDVNFPIQDLRFPSGLRVIVEKDDRRFGTLLVSKGAVEWRPTNKVYRRKISWDKFDQLMREIGNRV